MVVKKVKVKKVKKIKKAKVTKTDVKQNKEINLLKKKLKEIAIKFLKKQKKKLPTKSYDKIKNKIINRISTTKNIKTLERLLETLTKTPINQLPSRVSDFIPSRNNIKETIIKVAKEEVKEQVNERSPDVIRKCSEAREKFYELLAKYQNGEIDSADFFDIYIIVKKCSEALSVFLPSWSQITNLYRTGKSMLQYFKSFINRNLLNRGSAITDPISPPTPPPDDDNDDDEPQPPRPPPSSPPTPPDDDDDDDDMPPPPPAAQAPIDPLETPINISNTFLAEAPPQVNVETSTLSQALPYIVTAGLLGANAVAYNNVYNNFRNTQQRRISQAGALHQHTNVNREQVRQNVGAEQVVARNFNRRPSINPAPDTGFRTSPQQRAQRLDELISRDISEGGVASDTALMRQLSDIPARDYDISEDISQGVDAGPPTTYSEIDSDIEPKDPEIDD